MHSAQAGECVRIWTVHVDLSRELAPSIKELLSHDEQQRCLRMRSERRRRRFALVRAATRLILARYLNVPPRELCFGYGPVGKPFLAEPAHARSLHFNVSHADTLALCAVSEQHEVGVDLERVRDIDGLPDSYALMRSPLERCTCIGSSLFYHCWTAREACIKASGIGIDKLPSVRACHCVGDVSAWLRTAEGYFAIRRFTPAEGFVAAVCLGPFARPRSAPYIVRYDYDSFTEDVSSLSGAPA